MWLVRRGAFSTGVSHKREFVKAKYGSLKEEIIESGYVSMAQWTKLVELKGRMYWKTKKAKWLKHLRENDHKRRARPPELMVEHLFVIILYCDFSDLCTAFSGTYRRKNVFESLKSMKSRHSEFAIFGRLLNEVVNGLPSTPRSEESKRGYCDLNPRAGSGPFFCGLKGVRNIGSFAITLRGPCSTSTDKAVAVNFADSGGIVMKLNNDTLLSKEVRPFDCSWISNYCEESERLWIQGEWPIRIVSIIIVKSAKNYTNSMRALYLFDAMISAVYQAGIRKEGDASDYQLISKLMQWTLSGGVVGSSEIDEYIKKEWTLYLQNKKTIDLNLLYMNAHYKSMSKLVMFNVKKITDGVVEGNDNMLRTEWISMFPNVWNVAIYTSKDSYKFRLESLLQSIKGMSATVRSIWVFDGWKGWIGPALTDEISAAFNAGGWNVSYSDRFGVGLRIRRKA